MNRRSFLKVLGAAIAVPIIKVKTDDDWDNIDWPNTLIQDENSNIVHNPDEWENDDTEEDEYKDDEVITVYDVGQKCVFVPTVFPTIQAAIDANCPGLTIYCQGDFLEGPIHINKPGTRIEGSAGD